MERTRKQELARLKQALITKDTQITTMRCVLDNLPGSIYWKDKNGTYLGRNQYSGESMRRQGYPWRWKDIVGKTDYDLFPKEMADQFRQNDLEVMRTGKEHSVEETTYMPDGQQRIQLSIKRPLRNESGEVTGVIGNTVDITYLKHIEFELKEAKNKAEAAMHAKTEFIQNMQHDIRTPFSGVLGMAQCLYDQELDTNKKANLADIVHCAEELLNYCNRVLHLSEAEYAITEISEDRINIGKLANQIIVAEKPAANVKRLKLTLKIDNDVPCIIIGDQYKLYCILLNLISNAIKFTDKGTVTLEIIVFNEIKDKIILQFAVKDTGIGIPEGKQQQIYEKFTRLTPSNKGNYKGMGLGLYIVKCFIEAMHGSIELESEEGKGTKFYCQVPFKLFKG